MIIYLDIIFFENVLMNYIIIFTTGIIIKQIFKRWRILLASCVGAMYSIIMYLNIIPISSNFIMKIILSIIIVYIAFSPKKVKKLIKYLVIFYLTSFVFGGCVFALMYVIQPQLIQMKNGMFVGSYPIKIAIIGGIIACIITQISFKIVKSKITKKDMIYEMEIFYSKKHIKLKGLLDTGNLLKEPITGTPVIIVEKKKLYNLFPIEIIDNTEKILGGDTKLILQDSNIISKFRMIPFSSVGKENGMLLGIKVDYINILIDENKKVIKDVIVGIYDKTFTKNEIYSVIFGLDILEGGTHDECISKAKK